MPVGQLMSRATSDLQTVRFFLGYGLVFVFMQAFTLIIVTGHPALDERRRWRWWRC